MQEQSYGQQIRDWGQNDGRFGISAYRVHLVKLCKSASMQTSRHLLPARLYIHCSQFTSIYCVPVLLGCCTESVTCRR